MSYSFLLGNYSTSFSYTSQEQLLLGYILSRTLYLSVLGSAVIF